MDSEKIDELLKKYWECNSSLEEEQALQAYFREGPVPDHLKETAALFRYFAREKGTNLTDITFEKEILKKIRSRRRGKMATLVFNTMRIAAGILVFFVAIWLVRMEIRKASPVEVADTYDDPKMAFEETKKALMMISKSFSTAEEQARKINLFNEAQQEIKKENTKAEL
jgi:hypothetical protein